MKTKSVLLLSTLVTAALLLIVAFAVLSTVIEFANPPVAVGACWDAYEPDNTYTSTVTVTVPSFTSHSFHDEGDVDWAKFWGTTGITYTIETFNLAAGVDTRLNLYSWNGITLTGLASHDNRNFPVDLSSIITWTVTSPGWYYVEVGRFTGSYSGCNATYGLSIILTDVPCTTTLVIEPDTLTVGNTATMTATVVDCSSSPLAGKVITFSTTSGLGSGSISPITATTNASGRAVSYISSTLAGTKLVTATAPNLVAGTDTVTFTAGPPFTITLRAIPNTLPVSNTAVLSATVVDWYANPVPSQVITFSTSSGLGSGGISPITATTNASGQAVSSIRSTITGTKLVVATAPNLVTGTTTVTFTALSPYVYLPIVLKNHPPPPPTPTPTATAPPSTPGPPTPTPGPCYPLVERTITVGNDPRGVAYNSDDNRIYVANYGDGTVSVINGVSYGVTKVITGVTGADGVAYDPNHGLVYVTNQSIDALTVISAATNTIVRTLPVGDQPHGVAYNPTSHKVYVANYGDNTVTIIDANTMTTTATISGLSQPAHVAANPASNKVYVSNHGNGTVTVIRGSDDTEPPESPISLGSSGPYGIAADTQRNLIYVVSITVPDLNAPNLVTIDGNTDQVKPPPWGHVNIHKSDDSLVPLRVIAVNPYLGPSAGGGHLYITSSSDDVAGDGSHGTDQLLMMRKGWPEGFNKPNPLNVGSRPEEGIAVDLVYNRVFVTARDVNRLTVIQDTGDHGQLCSEAFTLDGYVIEPVP